MYHLIGLLSIGCTQKEDTPFDVPISTPDDTNVQDDETGDVAEPYISSRSSTQTRTFTYDRPITAGNPLKGMMSSYLWSEPNNDLPHSLEFIYLPLNSLISGEGVYTFQEGLEPYLEEASARGNHVVMRVFIDYPNREYGLPTYLEDLVTCTPYSEYGGGCSPDYSNSHLQLAILNFITEFGTQYDGDNRLAFVQMGLLGYWGEWHTFPNYSDFASDLFQQEVIETFDTSFNTTPIQIRYPVQDSPSRTIGFHDDSFAYSTVGDVEWYFWSKMLATGAEQRWMEVPTGGEVYPAIQSTLFTDDFVVGEDGQDFDSVVAITHTTYMLMYSAFSMDGTGYSGQQLENAKQSSLAMGYEFTVDNISVEASNLRGDVVDMTLDFAIRNSGVAPFYYSLSATIQGPDIELSAANLQNVQPSDNVSIIPVEITDVPIENVNQPWRLSLKSDVLLDNQVIHFANVEDDNGALTVTPNFVCDLDGQSFSLGEATDQNCYCDVDGLLYKTDGSLCQ